MTRSSNRDEEIESRNGSFSRYNLLENSPFIRGCVSGVMVVGVLQPFDVVKTVQQASGSSTLQAFRAILKQDGARGLWLRGLGPTLVRGAAGPGVYFSIIESTNHWFEKSKVWDFAQGAMARSFGAVIISPFSVLKSRAEWNPTTKARFNGFRDMFSGLTPTLARDIPFSGLFIIFYRSIKNEFVRDDDDMSSLQRFGGDFSAGVVAGMMATALTHPFDVIKTRRQLGLSIFQGNLFSGLTLRLAKRPLSTALTWAFYEGVTNSNLPMRTPSAS